MPSTATRWDNDLMEALPSDTVKRWTSHLALRRLFLGEVLLEPGEAVTTLYFPTTALVSMMQVLSDGATAEIALIGRDGMVGTCRFLGAESTPTRAVVQGAGNAYSLPAPVLMEEFHRAGPATHLLLRYTQALFTQMTQTAACNRHHTIEQQLCRWLLLSLDRIGGLELAMTQESIAAMLGVRREGVAIAAKKLQRMGLIEYARGHIRVLDRGGLERCSCECYEVVRDEYERLLGAPQAVD